MAFGDSVVVPDHLIPFFERYPCDDRAKDYFVSSPEAVQDTAVSEFKPRTEGEADYSGLLTSYVKRLRNSSAHLGGAGGGRSPGHASEAPDAETVAAVDDFVLRYPVDEGAYKFLLNSGPEVAIRVVNEFRPKVEGEADYSPLVMSFAKRCRNDAGGQGHHGSSRHQAGPSQSAINEFFSRYPVDDRALDYFSQFSPTIQSQVMRDFKPKVEGESDYSGLLTSFCKRQKDRVSQDAVYVVYSDSRYSAPPPSRYSAAPHAKGGSKGGSKGYGSSTIHNPLRPNGPNHRDLSDFRRRYPMDDRAFEYLCDSTPEVKEKVLSTFVPRRSNDPDNSAPVTAYIKQSRRETHEDSSYHGGGKGYGRDAPAYRSSPYSGGRSSGGSSDHALRSFLRRYPCDERASDYLQMLPAHVVQQVIKDFRPKREGESDYSAIVTSFAKRCRGNGPSHDEPSFKRARYN